MMWNREEQSQLCSFPQLSGFLQLPLSPVVTVVNMRSCACLLLNKDVFFVLVDGRRWEEVVGRGGCGGDGEVTGDKFGQLPKVEIRMNFRRNFRTKKGPEIPSDLDRFG